MILLNDILLNSHLIIKGREDLKAIKNHTLLYDIKTNVELYKFSDIALYNDKLLTICNTAELKKSYDCLHDKKLTNKYLIYYNKLKQNIEIKAHNPLVDAVLTLIIFNIFSSKMMSSK